MFLGTNSTASQADKERFIGSLDELRIYDRALDSSEVAELGATATPVFAPSPARIWMGLKNSDAVGLRADVRVELLVGGVMVAAGEVLNVATGSSGFNNAQLKSVPLTLAAGQTLSPRGTVSLVVSARRTCTGPGHNSGELRFWFNGQPIDAGSTRDAGSRFGIVGTGETSYFLRSGAQLSTTAASARQYIDLSISSAVACPARPYSVAGSWSVVLP